MLASYRLTFHEPAPVLRSYRVVTLCEECLIDCDRCAFVYDAINASDAAPGPDCYSCGSDGLIPLCPDCFAMTGGANGADGRPCNDGESCGAADCDGDPRFECECCNRLTDETRTYEGGALLCLPCYRADDSDSDSDSDFERLCTRLAPFFNPTPVHNIDLAWYRAGAGAAMVCDLTGRVGYVGSNGFFVVA